MSSLVFLLACVCCVRAIPVIPHYSPETAALAYYKYYNNPTQYLDPRAFQESWNQFWNNLMNQHNAIASQFSMVPQWPVPQNGGAAAPPGFQGSWSWVQGSAGPTFGSSAQAGATALAGTNGNEGFNNLAGANSQSGSNDLSGTNTNLGVQSVETYYNQQASQATSGANSNSGVNIHQGLNTHQGTNTGPSNYNGPLSGSSSSVVAPGKQPVFIQGATSNVGNAGSIYIPAK